MSEKLTTTQMQHIPPSTLNSMPTRIAYLHQFLNFTPSDGAAIQSSGALLAPLLPTLLDGIYTHLLRFDITAKAFAPPQPGFSGPAPTSVQSLSLDHPQIQHRRDFLKRYLLQLVRNDDWSADGALWGYMDKVGVMHTGEPGFAHRARRPELRVEFVHMGALLGFVEGAVVGVVMGAEGLEDGVKAETVRAWNKLLWIQNDLFARHYVVDRDSKFAPRGSTALAQAADAKYPETARSAQQALKFAGPFLGGFFAVLVYLVYTSLVKS